MDYVKTLENAGDDLIDSIRAAQDSTLAAVERVGTPIAKFLPKVPTPLPLDLPRTRVVAEATFRFCQRLAENQKEFTLKLLDAITPSVKGTGKAA